MISANKIVDAFKKDGWKSNPFEAMLELRDEDRDQLLDLILLCLQEVPDGGTFIDAAFSFLTESEFQKAIDEAIIVLRENTESEMANSVIAYACLQFPQLLKPYLTEFLEIQPNQGSYYDNWVWRDGGEKEVQFLCEHIEKSNLEKRYIAWECLVNIRNKQAILKASQLFNKGCRRKDIGFDIYSMLSGFEVKGDSVTQLYFDNTRHIVFPESFFENQDKPVWLSNLNHPTWTLENPDAVEAEFGGEISSDCGNCGDKLHRLVEIPSGILGNEAITLATCLSCLGWEEHTLFYRHDSFGKPESLTIREEKCVPEFKAEPLKSATIRLTPTPERWLLQDWGLSNSRENLNRVGGAPSWIQDSEYPRCPHCDTTMKFIAQFDSDLPTKSENEWLWGSGGICYSFLCNDCKISGFLWQCT